ncbi:MAG: tetratricopeptide repeat-containing sulfotransferase family protein [Rhodanobacteraceae bacterium]
MAGWRAGQIRATCGSPSPTTGKHDKRHSPPPGLVPGGFFSQIRDYWHNRGCPGCGVEMTNPEPSRRAETLEPLSPMAARLLKRAQKESRSGDAEAAMRTLTGTLALAPNHPEVMRWMGIAAQNLGIHAEAADCFQRALTALPDDADLHIGLGVALYRLGREDEGLTHLRRACEVAPDSAWTWYNLAEGLWPQGQADAVIDALRRTLEIDPSHVRARVALARAQAGLGRIDEAVADLRKALRCQPDYVEAWLALADLKTVSFNEQDVHSLQRVLANRNLSPATRTRFELVLARALEDQGDYARSFEVLTRANASERRRVKWDAAGERKRVESILRVFEKPVTSATDAGLGREAIFIASLPRSGSTLVEQILASHPEVEGANEIKDFGQVIEAEARRRGNTFPLWVPDATAQDWQRLGKEYLARTARWHERKPRFVDKNLLNWMVAGAALSMLPAARAVVVRRDPVETCLACYRQWFAQGAEFSYDLDEMADIYIDFWRLTRLWLKKFPDRVFDLEYETLVAEPEPTIRRLLDFCELSFDPACLEFHRTERTVLSAPSAAQVRQPLRRDTARAARYGNKLDRLRARLHDAGLPVEEAPGDPA